MSDGISKQDRIFISIEMNEETEFKLNISRPNKGHKIFGIRFLKITRKQK